MIYNVKYNRLKNQGVPQVGQIVSWWKYKFKIVSVSNMKEGHLDFRNKGGGYIEFIDADLIVETDESIEDYYRNLLEKGTMYVA